MADNVVPLHSSQAEMDEAWQRYDEAMRLLHAAYATSGLSEADRLELAIAATRAEQQFRTVFNRAPRRTTGQ